MFATALALLAGASAFITRLTALALGRLMGLTVVRLPSSFVFLLEAPVLVVDDFLVALNLTDGVALAAAHGAASVLVAAAPVIVGALAALTVAALLVRVLIVRVMT